MGGFLDIKRARSTFGTKPCLVQVFITNLIREKRNKKEKARLRVCVSRLSTVSGAEKDAGFVAGNQLQDKTKGPGA